MPTTLPQRRRYVKLYGVLWKDLTASVISRRLPSRHARVCLHFHSDGHDVYLDGLHDGLRDGLSMRSHSEMMVMMTCDTFREVAAEQLPK